MAKKSTVRKTTDEQSADLILWRGDGCVANHKSGKPRLPEVSVGRTDSRRGLGFQITKPNGAEITAFVLDRAQVQALSRYLQDAPKRLRAPR
jgi:hypothetical protein